MIPYTLVQTTSRNKKSPNWSMTWDDPATGKARKKSLKTPNRKVAAQLADKIAEKMFLVHEGLMPAAVINDKRLTWDQAVKEFLAHSSLLHAEHPQTTEAYKWILHVIAKELQPKSPRDITQKVVDRYAASRLGDGIKPGTVNKDLRHLRAFLRWCHKQGYMPILPTIKNEHVREDVRTPINIPERVFEKLYATIDDPELELVQRPAAWWKVFLKLLWESGMRRGEVLGLRWRSLDFQDRTLHVGEGSKGRRERHIPLTWEAVELLARFYVDEGEPADAEHIVPWPDDRDIRRIYEDWRRLKKLAGVSFRFKDCRSSTGSSMINAGVPTITVRNILGHASVATTEKFYASPSPKALRDAVEARLGRS